MTIFSWENYSNQLL